MTYSFSFPHFFAVSILAATFAPVIAFAQSEPVNPSHPPNAHFSHPMLPPVAHSAPPLALPIPPNPHFYAQALPPHPHFPSPPLGHHQDHPHHARLIHLPHQGQVRGCDARMPATNMHSPTQSCAQSSRSFLSNWQRNFHLRKQCPTGTTMQGISNITCADAPMAGFRSGSVYNAIVCCETNGANAAPSAFFPALPQSPSAFPPAQRSFVLPSVEMRFESTAIMQCPELGIAHPRASVSFVPLLRAQAAVLDRRCATHGGKNFASATLHHCGFQPNPHVLRQIQYFGEMDVVCAR